MTQYEGVLGMMFSLEIAFFNSLNHKDLRLMSILKVQIPSTVPNS